MNNNHNNLTDFQISENNKMDYNNKKFTIVNHLISKEIGIGSNYGF